MSSEQASAANGTGTPQQRPSGLENHLRNLIISNSPNDGLSNENAQDAPAADPQKSASPTPKGGKKRLNQAQRRQMNAELSIPVDTRPQQPPLSAVRSPTRGGHYGQGSLSSNRYMGPGAHFHQPSQEPRRMSVPHDQVSWDRSPQRPGANNSQSFTAAGHFPRNHQAPGPRHDMQSSQNFRSGLRPPFEQGGRQPARPNDAANQASQAALLDRLSYMVVANSEIERSEIAEKEAFRQRIELICRQVISQYEEEANGLQGFPGLSVELKCFGSLSSGFATKAADMDLGLLSPYSGTQPDAPGSPIPRLIEKAFLDAGLGARLLTRTRVPIIKLCESPPEPLRQGLLEERAKWENGVEDEHHDADGDLDQEQDTAVQSQDEENPPSDDVSPQTAQTSGHFEVPSGVDGQMQHFRLKQGPKNPISAYYGLAKRILRRAGGRDVTMSNWRSFSPREWDILDRVCRAFVAGIADRQLREQVQLYWSNIPPSTSGSRAWNSLQGTFSQIEGEQCLNTWRSWLSNNAEANKFFQADHAISSWEDLHRRFVSISDPMLFAKELQLYVDRLKRLPSMKLAILEQEQQETPTEYFERTKAIVANLGMPKDNISIPLEDLIIERYVSGIHFEEIRATIKARVQATEKSSQRKNLDSVVLHHKSLQLAREFERALGKEIYSDQEEADIRRYIDLLKDSLSTANTGQGLKILVPSGSEPLVSRISMVQDPHKAAPNQPRDRYRDRLEFPKSGVGVQCDINFSAHLALQNTALLRCYSHTDPRVRPMVLFVKHWARKRGINSGYRGTLSSYGYVLMVLHYLVNVAQPFVCPNLQQLAPPLPPHLSPAEVESATYCKGCNVRFWRNEDEIQRLAAARQLNGNVETIGQLLRGFFEYYAQGGMMSSAPMRGFDWGREVLSLRTQGGLLSKEMKGWTGAKTVIERQTPGPESGPQGQTQPRKQSITTTTTTEVDPQSRPSPAAQKSGEVKEVRLRYLFAIEDPFELDHNVARTVTHNGIVSIRDEFRRAWRIIRATTAGRHSSEAEEDLLKDINEVPSGPDPFLQLLVDIHGSIQTS